MSYELHNENCLHTMDLMPDGYVDLTVTSPPYDKLRAYKGYSFEFERIARELYRVTAKGGVVVWVVADSTVGGTESGTSFKQALFFKACGSNLHDTMIYAKKNYIPLTHNRYEQCWEYMFVFSKGKPKTFNPIMVECKEAGVTKNWARAGYCKTIKEGAQRRRDEDVTTAPVKISPNLFYYACGAAQTGHPAPFPEQLAEDQILTWINPGDLVYDPFSGSGTTVMVAVRTGRNAVGSEIAAEYCDISLKRVQLL